jgi:hypothetical protein
MLLRPPSIDQSHACPIVKIPTMIETRLCSEASNDSDADDVCHPAQGDSSRSCSLRALRGWATATGPSFLYQVMSSTLCNHLSSASASLSICNRCRSVTVVDLICNRCRSVTVPDTMFGAVLSLGHAEGVSFTKAHLLRSIVCIALASLSLESTAQVEHRNQNSLVDIEDTPALLICASLLFQKFLTCECLSGSEEGSSERQCRISGGHRRLGHRPSSSSSSRRLLRGSSSSLWHSRLRSLNSR